MTIRIGINGFGRIGRLALRTAWPWSGFEFVHVNDPAGDAGEAAHLLEYDSVHGIWDQDISHNDEGLLIDGHQVTWSRATDISEVDWGAKNIDVLVECSGRFRTSESLQPYLDAGIPRVVVSAPVKSPDVLNIVMGVNDREYDAIQHSIVTAASCTTNCIAPVVDVIHETFGLRHGQITTIHDVTSTQNILDNFHKDPRRARAAGMSLIPTTTGSAKAIIEIFPELEGRMDGIAVRVPLANASLTDCVFEVSRKVTIEEVNDALKEAADGRLKGILGYEEKPLVSVDFKDDPRSSIVDALSTNVVNGTQVKILTWYDNEIGYVNRLMELARKVGG
ncbi:MAG: ArsJ-associated glyceraldehyde-3-phosphate dehydrogenase [Pseudomonadota bacterium]